MPSKIFEYQEEMDKLDIPCPPRHYENSKRVAYRWVFKSMEDERNFKPQYFKSPKYSNDPLDEKKCQALGLSFFDSKENAVRMFNFWLNLMGNNAYKFLGKNVAEGNLLIDDGVNSDIDEHGHFTHHPYKEENYKVVFSIIEKL